MNQFINRFQYEDNYCIYATTTTTSVYLYIYTRIDKMKGTEVEIRLNASFLGHFNNKLCNYISFPIYI